MLITVYHKIILSMLIGFFNILVSWSENETFVLSFLAKNAHNFLDGFPDIEHFIILAELASFDLRIVEEILNHEVHDLSCVLLNLFAGIQLIKDGNALFKCLTRSDIWI